MGAGFAGPAGDDLLEPARRALAEGVLPEHAEWVKRTRLRAVARLRLAGGAEVFVKRDREPPGLRRLGASRARREHRNLSRLLALGIAAVEPLGSWEERREDGGRDSFLATRAVAGARPLSQRLVGASPSAARAWLREAARTARRLHDAGLWHRDLHPGNLLVAPDPEGRGDRLVLVDVQKLRPLPCMPRLLRVRDLAMLLPGSPEVPWSATPGEIAQAYLGGGSSRAAVGRLAEAIQHAAARRLRARLRSRGRRCVVDSTGFRAERSEGRVVHRRVDVSLETVLAALEGGREPLPGGPPPGPAPSPFARGQGAAEPGAPARAAIRVRSLPGGWPRIHPGMRAWRNAHALLLRGFDTPAPLALVEERGLLRVRRSTFLERWEELREPSEVLREGSDAAVAAAREVGRVLGRLHRAGVVCRGRAALPLRLRIGHLPRIVVVAPERLRFGKPPRVRTRAAALRGVFRTLSGVAPAARRDRLREALVAGYTEGAGRREAARQVLERALRDLPASSDPGGRIR